MMMLLMKWKRFTGCLQCVVFPSSEFLKVLEAALLLPWGIFEHPGANHEMMELVSAAR